MLQPLFGSFFYGKCNYLGSPDLTCKIPDCPEAAILVRSHGKPTIEKELPMEPELS
jgi:hypothetical protein